jgi:hypothetical protein
VTDSQISKIERKIDIALSARTEEDWDRLVTEMLVRDIPALIKEIRSLQEKVNSLKKEN